ncbi:MAG: fructose-6-phosphate aldolase [Thermoplasmata archaeon]|nr:MAG: fructose-6-phosphate aldolase [Thermoplasmata archaeon]RLF37316.1 MAG: fructose-6-phosphate aldolase [Thermoplasmata archaeon]RLF53568.1 MAG: fructose-6-phosphate aldolase [Thermoplasmata archaeon]
MTEIFLDTANIDHIKEILEWGVIRGVTTNQKIFLKEKGCNFEEQSKTILKLVEPYPVSLEGPNNLDELLKTAREYNTWGENVVIKVPMLPDGNGLKAVKILESEGIKTNVTAMMSVNQAFLAITAGASYASLFFNRIRDSGDNPVEVVKQSRSIIDEGGYKTKLIVGSIRKPEDVVEIVSANPHIITIPYKILKQMPYHERTVSTLEEFDRAWIEFKKAEKKQ